MAKEVAEADPKGPLETGTDQVGSSESEALWTDPDGNAYFSKDDLTKAWANRYSRDEHLRQSTEFDKRRKAFEAQQREFEAERQRVEREKERIKDYDMLDQYVTNRPDAWERWKEEARKGASANDVREQLKAEIASEYGTKLEELEAWRQQQEAEAQRTRIFASLKEKYGSNFDEKAMDTLIDTLLSEDDPEAIADALYWSERGRRSQTEIAEELAGGEREKSEASIPGGTSLRAPKAPKIPPNATIDDMREKGKARYQ